MYWPILLLDPAAAQIQYIPESAKPTPPPIAHFLNPAKKIIGVRYKTYVLKICFFLPEDLYNSPVAVPAKIVLTSSSSPLAQESKTPKPEYITASVPKVFAVADPCFMT